MTWAAAGCKKRIAFLYSNDSDHSFVFKFEQANAEHSRSEQNRGF